MPRRNKQIPHDRFAFNSACKTKTRYATKELAKEAVAYRHLTDSSITLSVYRCELCGGWHMTRRTQTRTE